VIADEACTKKSYFLIGSIFNNNGGKPFSEYSKTLLHIKSFLKEECGSVHNLGLNKHDI